MNKIPACILSIQNHDILNIVSFDFCGFKMSMMSLELKDIRPKDKVLLFVKPTSVAIGKNFMGDISYSNQLKGKIKSLKNGELLTSLEVLVGEFVLCSIITKNSSLRMNLKKGDEVVCFIKASDLSILEKTS
ncbi:MAG: transporter [Proteobacteria bacterium]|nr:MAG: transporter [Pseudomonadota bacterium]